MYIHEGENLMSVAYRQRYIASCTNVSGERGTSPLIQNLLTVTATGTKKNRDSLGYAKQLFATHWVDRIG